MQRVVRPVLVLVVLLMVLESGAQAGPWVFVARKVLGRVQNLASPAHDKKQGQFDFATVLLEAPAEKVYQTATMLIGENPALKVTSRDDANQTLEFTHGDLAVSMKVSSLGKDVSQLMVACPRSAEKSGGTSLAVQKILAVCNKMGAQCSVSSQ